MKKTAAVLSLLSLVLVSCKSDQQVEQPPVDPPKEQPAAADPISDFALRLTKNGGTTSYKGTIDHSAGRITVDVPGVDWIDDIAAAAAEFTTADGVSMKVGEVKQTSGVTENDFTTEVVYTAVDADGKQTPYTVNVVSPQSSGLPVVRIDTQGGAAINSKETYVTSTFTIVDPSDPTNNIDQAPAGVRGRGNSTWGYPKKPYRVKLDKKASVFGLTSAKNWVLLANWQDPTLMMNSVAFEVSRRLGLGFTPSTTHVELFLNGSYKGSYTLCEHIQVNEGRVDIDETQDVFLEIDGYYDEVYKFRSSGLDMPVMFKSPEFEDVSDTEREEFIADVKADFEAMENAVMSLSGWKDHMDTASFIDFVIVNELARNIELGHPKSTYLYKKRGGKWTWGPVWDLDWAYGFLASGQEYWREGSSSAMLYITGAGFSEAGVSSKEPGVRFFTQLFRDAGFKAEFKARWNVVRPRLSDIDSYVEDLGSKLAESDALNKRVWATQYTKDYSGQIAKMSSWLKQRLEAMDAVIANF